MDPSAFFKGGDVGLKFLRTDVIAEKFGVAEPPLRFFIGIILGKNVFALAMTTIHIAYVAILFMSPVGIKL